MKDRFGVWIQAAMDGKLSTWTTGPTSTPQSRLAFIILLDQLSRNAYRETPKMFSQDEMALKVAMEAIFDHHDDQGFSLYQRLFLYLPLMHSEDPKIQTTSIKLYGDRDLGVPMSIEFANRHAEIIHRFGRYPHRNVILGRESTPEEIEFLKEPMSSF